MIDLIKEGFSSDSIYDPENDPTQYHLSDTRKPKLTLAIVNKLRMHREFKASEDAKRNVVVATVYAPQATDENNEGF